MGYYPKVIPSVKEVILAGKAKNFLLYGFRRNVSSFENRASIHANFELGAADSPVTLCPKSGFWTLSDGKNGKNAPFRDKKFARFGNRSRFAIK